MNFQIFWYRGIFDPNVSTIYPNILRLGWWKLSKQLQLFQSQSSFQSNTIILLRYLIINSVLIDTKILVMTKTKIYFCPNSYELSTRPAIRHLESRRASNLGREKWVWVRKEQITNEIYRSLDKRAPVMRRFDNLDLANQLDF